MAVSHTMACNGHSHIQSNATQCIHHSNTPGYNEHNKSTILHIDNATNQQHNNHDNTTKTHKKQFHKDSTSSPMAFSIRIRLTAENMITQLSISTHI